MNHETGGGAWRDFAEIWGKLTPPSRPSRGDVAQYGEAARTEAARGGRLRCLILGCTPELRSIGHQLGFTVVCADTDRAMFERLAPMVSPRGAEEFLHADWLALPEGGAFDVVLGDGSLNMVPTDRHEALIAAIARATRPGGAVVLRVHVRTPPPFETMEEVVAWYRREHRGKPFYATIRTPLYMWWMAQHAVRFVDGPAVFAYVRGLQAAGVITDEELGSRTHGGIRLYIPSAAEFEALASRWFAIEGVRHGRDYGFPENHPIYVLRRRGDNGRRRVSPGSGA